MSEIIWENAFVEKVICNNCKHKQDGIKCKAFDIIPDDIIFGTTKHNSIIDGQNGDYIYEPLEK